MNRMRIVDAAEKALESLGGGPSTPRQIYGEIERLGLYSFGAKSPVSVLSSAMREKTAGNPRLKGPAMFESDAVGSYRLVCANDPKP